MYSINLSVLCTLNLPVESCDWNNDGVVTQEDVDKVNDIYLGQMTTELNEGDILRDGDSTFLSLALWYLLEAIEIPKRDLVFNSSSITDIYFLNYKGVEKLLFYVYHYIILFS